MLLDTVESLSAVIFNQSIPLAQNLQEKCCKVVRFCVKFWLSDFDHSNSEEAYSETSIKFFY